MLGSLPTKEEFMDIQKEYNFKQGQTENAETTLQMLKVEFQKRDSDLVKLEQAEERINTELKSLTLKLKWCRTRSKTSSAIPNGTRRNFWTKETVSWRTRLSWTNRGPPCKQRLLIYILSWKIQSMITNSKKPSSIDMKTTKNSRIRRRSSPWMSNISTSWNHISLRKFIIYF